MILAPYQAKCVAKEDMTEEESYRCLTHILRGKCEPDQILDILTALTNKGETVSEIVGFARAMRDHMVKVPLESPCIDLCGTGGSGKDRFNISTGVAFLLSALDIPVAKHGNRGSKAPNGSFDFLEALGIRFDLEVPQIQTIFKEMGLCFLFARTHHPAMRFVAPARKQLGCRTIFNCLGPLCNPAGVSHQLLGVSDSEIAHKLAHALQRLNTTKTMIVQGGDGLDELSLTSPSKAWDVTPDSINERMIDPTFCETGSDNDVKVTGTAIENASLFLEILTKRQVTHPIARALALNAGAACMVYGAYETIEEGYHRSLRTISDGRALEALNRYKDLSQSF